MRYLFGPEASGFQRGLAAAALSLLVCACGLCSLSSATAIGSIVQDNAATRQARPTSTLVPTFSPTATPTSTPATTPDSVPTLPPLPSLSETPTPDPAAPATVLPEEPPAATAAP